METPTKRRYGLSKSKIAAYEQCPRRLWQQTHAPERAKFDDDAQARFAAGHQVGEIACALCPGGVMVDVQATGLAGAVAQTAQLMSEMRKHPIFEATFEHDGVLVRIDILQPEGQSWRAFEVKSTTGVKEQHRADLATQVWVMREAGVMLAGAAIRHIDKSFVLTTPDDYAGLFTDSQLMAELESIIAERPALVQRVRKMLDGPEPQVSPGKQCGTPYPCEFSAACNRDLPQAPQWPVTLLPQGRGNKWLALGIDNLLDLDETTLPEKQARIVAATRTGFAYHNSQSARAEMADWGWPRVWLDFETINPAIPRWIGTHPYEQTPFQFSAHVEHEDGRLIHHEFLDTSGADPRPACARKLAECIPADATIIAYNASFEKSVLRLLAAVCPEQAQNLRAMAARTVDLLPIARKHWYHRDQRGSWSIKAVLPTLAKDGYAGLQVQDGGAAQSAWLEASDPGTSTERRHALEAALKAYCARDTLAMIDVARALAGDANANSSTPLPAQNLPDATAKAPTFAALRSALP
jgi:hypothetical protein